MVNPPSFCLKGETERLKEGAGVQHAIPQMVEYAAMHRVRSGFDRYVRKVTSESTVLGIEGIRRHADLTHHFNERSDFLDGASQQTRRSGAPSINISVPPTPKFMLVPLAPGRFCRNEVMVLLVPTVISGSSEVSSDSEARRIADRGDVHQGSLGANRYRVGNSARRKRDIDPDLPSGAESRPARESSCRKTRRLKDQAICAERHVRSRIQPGAIRR